MTFGESVQACYKTWRPASLPTMLARLCMLKPGKHSGNLAFVEGQKALYFGNAWGRREGGWGRVGSGVGAYSDVNSKSTHAKTVGIYSIFDDFVWVKHVWSGGGGGREELLL